MLFPSSENFSEGPPDDWLPRLPERFRRCEVSLTTLGAARGLAEPAFIKPPNDKSFPARVWRGEELPEGYDPESPVLVGEVVTWEKEFRCFVLDRRPRTISVYRRQGELQREEGFVATDAELSEAEALVLEVCAAPAVDLLRVVGVSIIRAAEREAIRPLPQLPPRVTRIEPASGPSGSAAGDFS